MKYLIKALATICLLSISSTVFASDSVPATTAVGPFICACEIVSNLSEQYSQMIVTDLGTGKVYKLGKFVGESIFRTVSDRQSSTLCVHAISMQAICINGKEN